MLAMALSVPLCLSDGWIELVFGMQAHTLSCKEILASTKIWVLPSGTFS